MAEPRTSRPGFPDRAQIPAAASPAARPGAPSLSHGSLEIARVLADRNGLTFRSDGTCMYPTIRPGDVLQIQSRPMVDIKVGDIAVCRRPKHLFSHRVMAKGTEQGRAYIITRPDRTLKEDSPTFDENLLGVVVEIKRRGKSVPLGPASLNPARRFYYSLVLTSMETRMRARLWRRGFTARLLETPLYPGLARVWFRLARPALSFTVRLPMPALGDAVYRQMAPDDFSVERDWRGRPVRRWTLTLHLSGYLEPAAWVTLVQGEDGLWQTEDSRVAAWCRGGGLEEKLLARAEEILHRTGHRLQMRPPDLYGRSGMNHDRNR